eukprot:ctg_562.g261
MASELNIATEKFNSMVAMPTPASCPPGPSAGRSPGAQCWQRQSEYFRVQRGASKDGSQGRGAAREGAAGGSRGREVVVRLTCVRGDDALGFACSLPLLVEVNEQRALGRRGCWQRLWSSGTKVKAYPGERHFSPSPLRRNRPASALSLPIPERCRQNVCRNFLAIARGDARRGSLSGGSAVRFEKLTHSIQHVQSANIATVSAASGTEKCAQCATLGGTLLSADGTSTAVLDGAVGQGVRPAEGCVARVGAGRQGQLAATKDGEGTAGGEGAAGQAPNVPPPIQRRHPARVMVDLNVIVKELPIDDTSTYEFWTFEEAVPGPMIRARVGDLMQVRLTNRDQSGMYHNMDFHAVLGPGGGATVLNCSTDETKTATFKLTYPGLFIYHCAVDPVSVHIANGMYGLLLVEPEEGLPPAEKEYYVVQSELYTEDEPDTPNSSLLPFSIDRVMDERPNYVVFNGRVGAHLEDNPLKATVGDRVRMYVGNPGPNLVSSFHVIGTIFDKAYRDGSLVNEPARGLQTLMIPAGSAAIVELDAWCPALSPWWTTPYRASKRVVSGSCKWTARRGTQNCSTPRTAQLLVPAARYTPE